MHVWREWAAHTLEERALWWARTVALISLSLPLPSSPSPSLLMINQTHRPLWSAVSCYLVTSCRDLPGPLVFPWRLCLLAALSRWPVATPGPDPQLPASTASWSHTAVSVCSRRTAAPHHARLVKFNFWLVGVVADWSRQRCRKREGEREGWNSRQ